MTTPAPPTGPKGCTRFVLFGSLPGGEVWNASFTAATVATPGGEAAKEIAQLTGASTWTAFTANVKALLASTASLGGVRAYVYDAAGRLLDTASNAASAGAGSGGVVHPNYVSLAVTLRTADTTKSGRGRMYLPATGVPVAGTGLFDSVTIGALLTNFAGVLAAVEGVVWSPTRDEANSVTRVEADTKPDSQRPRNVRLVGSRSGVNVA